MASTLIFDMADPGVKKMVEGWADNMEYEATILVRTGEGEKRNVAEVISFEPEEMEESPDEDEGMEPEMTEEEEPAMASNSSKKSIPAIKYK